MRKFITILFLLISYMLYSQDGTQYKPTVAWKTLVDSVIYLNTDTFIVKVDPIDYNDPGAINRTIGGYLMDNFGHIYTIIDSTLTAITVVDEFDYNIAPVDGEIGIVYKSVGNGNAPYIAPVLYEFLDTRAKDNADRLFKDILWKQADLYPQDSAYIQFDSDTIIWDATKTDVQDIEDSLSYYMLTESFTDSIPTIKLTRFDSTGFRVTIPQVVDLQNSLNQLNNMINEGFTNAHEADHLFQNWNRTDGINIYKKQIFDLNKLTLEELTIGETTVTNISDDHTFADNSDSALVTERAIKAFVQNSISGGVTYLGGWNANTNTPTLSDATGSNGDMYSITVTGTRDLGSGSVTWTAGGLAIHNGTKYEFLGYDAVVASVNGFTGTVNLYPELSNDSLFIRGSTTSVDLSGYLDNTDNQELSIDSTGRVFTITLEDGGNIKFEDTNTTYDLSGYATRSELHDTADVVRSEIPTLLTELDSTGFRITRSQINDLDIQYFEKELIDSENNIDLGFAIDNTCLVILNGQVLPQTVWDSSGTSLNLNLDVKMYDNLIVKKQ